MIVEKARRFVFLVDQVRSGARVCPRAAEGLNALASPEKYPKAFGSSFIADAFAF